MCLTASAAQIGLKDSKAVERKTADPLGAPRCMTTLLTSSASRISNLYPKNATASCRRRIFPYVFALQSPPIAVHSVAIATSIYPGSW
jgi:hypothetical protein